jgi:aspartate/methionine/tyrosine aminotransferase
MAPIFSSFRTRMSDTVSPRPALGTPQTPRARGSCAAARPAGIFGCAPLTLRGEMAGPAPNALSRSIVESATLAIAARAAALRTAGRDVISLGAGEPDFPTPEPVASAGIGAIRAGQTRYTAAAGLPELREAAAAWLRTEFGLAFEPRQVMASSGAKGALHMALSCLIEPGDAVLVLAPYWVSYPDLVRIAGGVVRVLDPVPDQGFVHDREQIASAAREHRAKGIILNFPGNPSGAVPTRAQLQGIVDAAAAADLWILSDEIYATMLYDGATHHSPAALRGAEGRTLVVNGGAKSHSFTGWRVGFLAGPAPIIDAAIRIQSQVLGNPCTISQIAALEICRGDHRAEIARRMRAFDERRRFLVAEVARIPMLRLDPPRGAFYALVDARALCARLRLDDVELCEALLEDALVATVPGSAFGIPGYVRLSYAASTDEIREALARIARFVAARV